MPGEPRWGALLGHVALSGGSRSCTPFAWHLCSTVAMTEAATGPSCTDPASTQSIPLSFSCRSGCGGPCRCAQPRGPRCPHGMPTSAHLQSGWLVTEISAGRASGCEPQGADGLLPAAGPGSACVCAVWVLGRPATVMASARQGHPCHHCLRASSHGAGALRNMGGQRALTPVRGEVSAWLPAAHTGLGTWEVAFQRGISHPDVKRVPGKRGHVTELHGVRGGRWTSRLWTHLRCHSGNRCSCPQPGRAACLRR